MFAEGSRGGELFDNFFLLFNPNASPVGADVYFNCSDGLVLRKQYTIPANRRLTIAAGDIPELAGRDFGTIVIATGGIVAERAMYWRPVGTPVNTPWVGGHVSLGTVGVSQAWHFAEGAAQPGFDTFYLLYNPNGFPITVAASYYTESAGVISRAYALGPHSRATIYLNAEVGNVGGTAAQFSSANHFVGERSIYWGRGRVEGTNTGGMTSAAYQWYLPEGVSGGSFETFLLLGNPHGSPAVVDLSLQIEGYGQITQPAHLRRVVPAQGRLTLYMPQVLRELEQSEGLPLGALSSATFATSVRVFAGSPIVAEHAVYWGRDGSNFWRAGATAFGTPR
jgi:hypothetical protein